MGRREILRFFWPSHLSSRPCSSVVICERLGTRQAKIYANYDRVAKSLPCLFPVVTVKYQLKEWVVQVLLNTMHEAGRMNLDSELFTPRKITSVVQINSPIKQNPIPNKINVL